MNKGYRRTKIFIDPAVQGALLWRLAAHWLYLGLTVFTCLLLLQVFASGLDHSLAWHLRTLWDQYGVILIVVVCVLPAFAYDSLKLSHRFAGPIVSLRATLHQLAEGQSARRLKFRDGDFWSDLADEVNAIAERLGQQGDHTEVQDEPTAEEIAARG